MAWEWECLLGGCTEMLTAFFRRLAELWAVQAVQEETDSAVLEMHIGCGSGDGAAAAMLGYGAEPAFWHWSSQRDGGRMSPPPAPHLHDLPLHRHQQGNVVGLVVAAVPRQGPAAPWGHQVRVGWDGRLWLGR